MKMSKTTLLRLTISLLYLLLAVNYAISTPIFEAGDELWHYPMLRHLADGNPLPVQVFSAADAGPWKQQASQPPLYYYAAAALTSAINTADWPLVRYQNPHVDNGIMAPDGNRNLVIHNEPSFFGAGRLQGTRLSLLIARLLSVALGLAAINLTFAIARATVPRRPELWLGAMGIHAFLPMFLFIAGAVNNDNGIIFLAALAIWLMVRENGGRYKYWQLGIVIGLAMITKISGILLLPLAAGALFLEAFPLGARRTMTNLDPE